LGGTEAAAGREVGGWPKGTIKNGRPASVKKKERTQIRKKIRGGDLRPKTEPKQFRKGRKKTLVEYKDIRHRRLEKCSGTVAGRKKRKKSKCYPNEKKQVPFGEGKSF